MLSRASPAPESPSLSLRTLGWPSASRCDPQTETVSTKPSDLPRKEHCCCCYYTKKPKIIYNHAQKKSSDLVTIPMAVGAGQVIVS